MQFQLEDAVAVLTRTPATLRALLKDLPSVWTTQNEGPETWSPFDVVGHLNHAERADWIPRAQIIMQHGEAQAFPPFDRLAQFEESNGKTLGQLLDEFAALRAQSLATLRALKLTDAELAKTGQHPAFGRVTLKELLATWVAHDLDHIAQIVRVMAKQYAVEVGPWQQYISLIHERKR